MDELQEAVREIRIATKEILKSIVNDPDLIALLGDAAWLLTNSYQRAAGKHDGNLSPLWDDKEETDEHRSE